MLYTRWLDHSWTASLSVHSYQGVNASHNQLSVQAAVLQVMLMWLRIALDRRDGSRSLLLYAPSKSKDLAAKNVHDAHDVRCYSDYVAWVLQNALCKQQLLGSAVMMSAVGPPSYLS